MKKRYQLSAFFFYSNQSNDLDQDGKKGMDSGYKVDSTGPADGLDEDSEGKRN